MPPAGALRRVGVRVEVMGDVRRGGSCVNGGPDRRFGSRLGWDSAADHPFPSIRRLVAEFVTSSEVDRASWAGSGRSGATDAGTGQTNRIRAPGDSLQPNPSSERSK